MQNSLAGFGAKFTASAEVIKATPESLREAQEKIAAQQSGSNKEECK